MRKKAHRNKIIAAFIVVFFISASALAYLYFDAKKEALIKNFLSVIEDELSKYAGLKVSIGDISGGFSRGITLEDINISRQDGNRLVEIKKLVLNYRIWNLFLGQFNTLNRVEIIYPKIFLAKNLNSNTDSVFAGTTAVKQKILFSKFSKYILFPRPVNIYIYGGVIESAGGANLTEGLKGSATFDGNDLIFHDVTASIKGVKLILSGAIKRLFLNNPELSLSAYLENEFAKGLVGVSGDFGAISLDGSLVFLGDIPAAFNGKYFTDDQFFLINRINFADSAYLKGDINFKEAVSRINLDISGGNADIVADFSKYPDILYNASVNHIKLGDFDFVTEINCYTHFEKNFLCRIDTDGLIINYKPYGKFTGEISADENLVELKSMNFGDEFECSGFIGREKPFYGEFEIAIKDLLLEKFLELVPSSGNTKVAGVLNANFKIKGDLKGSFSEGRLELADGTIGNVNFERMITDLKGRDSILSLDGSRIKVKNGFLIMSGFIDTRKFGKSNLLEDIKITTDNNAIVFEGWDITKDKDANEVNLSKPVGKDFNISLKTKTKSDDAMNKENKVSELELKYKLESEDSFLMKLKGQNEEFIGIEHKIKF